MRTVELQYDLPLELIAQRPVEPRDPSLLLALDRAPRRCGPSRAERSADKPCLTTCPVGSLSEGVYDVPACVAHISSPAGDACLALSCRARRACPVGRDYAYGPDQSRFHMEAFVRARRSHQ